MLSKEDTLCWIEIVNLFRSQDNYPFGNCCDSDDFNCDGFQEEITKILASHPEAFDSETRKALQPPIDNDDELDYCRNVVDMLKDMFFGRTEFYTRVYAGHKVKFCPVEVTLEDVTEEFK